MLLYMYYSYGSTSEQFWQYSRDQKCKCSSRDLLRSAEREREWAREKERWSRNHRPPCAVTGVIIMMLNRTLGRLFASEQTAAAAATASHTENVAVNHGCAISVNVHYKIAAVVRYDNRRV